jgi:transaldolase/glucose-6-phosphate isomerase
VPPAANPGIQLGLILGAAAKAGRDKVTLVVAKGVSDLGAWLEQLLAESTGKHGLGLIPIDAEPLGRTEAYGKDRVFVSISLNGEEDSNQAAALAALEGAGQPMIRISMTSREQLFQAFFHWEVAVAIAGAVIGINPFDQPDVEASKVKARELTDAYDKDGALPEKPAALRINGVALFGDDANAQAVAGAAKAANLEAWLGAHFARAGPGDYVALLPYLDRNEANIAVFQKLRTRIRDARGVATAVGFGPRFQHSTGQAYKGGPNSGVFLQVTATEPVDLAIPGNRASFGVVERAQALGDFEVLNERGRRLLRLDLGDDIEGGLSSLSEALERALD